MLACLLSSLATSRGNLVAGMLGSILLIFGNLCDALKSLVSFFLMRVRSSCLMADLLAGMLLLRKLVLLFRLRCAPSQAFLASSSTLSLPGIPLWLGIHRILILAFVWIRLVVAKVR